MIINDKRALAYIAVIEEIKEIPGYDRVEHARIGAGWWVIVSKNDNFNVGDKCVYFEVDSKVPSSDSRFAFLENRNYKIKTLKMCKVYSQGLIMPLSAFPEFEGLGVHTDVTDKLKVTYAVEEDNARKNFDPDAKYKSMTARHKNIFKKPWARWMMRRSWGRKVMFFFFGKKKDKKNGFPIGRFPGVAKTDQERCENMPYILKDKTPYIVTQKCDGSSGTYILERKGKRKFEFYVCSRNVRMMNDKQECFYGSHNYYWEVAIKYDIERKMREWLIAHPKAEWVCWQGEICAPEIQKNPHHLTETHFFCFHWTDSIDGRLSILEAKERWLDMDMEVVPIVNENYILPDDFEEFKLSADGKYDPIVCEGDSNCAREGYVYYKTTDPTFSFKNVSREYLLKH